MLPVALIGLGLTVAVERLLVPRPALRRPADCWLLHAGLWCVAFGLLYALTARPLFSGVNVLLLWLLIVLVSNAKYHSLREPFVCADFEYFSDAVKFPRLYLPFFGFGKAALLAVGFLVYLWAGLNFEVAGARLEALLPLALGLGLLRLGHRSVKPSFDAERDVRGWGLAASLWRYFWAARAPVDRDGLGSPFAGVSVPASGQPTAAQTGALPDLVSVQSESFFDVRGLWPGVRPQVLDQYDLLASQALARGKLQVAAWGANTVRTEFAFLTGIGEDRLGVHRFNPYRAIAAGWNVSSVASYLKRLGYRTICIHPYPANFYRRDRVYPRLGFDEFLDIRVFEDTMRFGPYIGDVAVADKVSAIVHGATGPVFIFVITMENHGPLHLERVAPADIDALYAEPPPPGCEDLTIYLRHLRNADRMIAMLRRTLEDCDCPAGLCWYGDHVPIMPSVYEMFGAPNGNVEYVYWSNQKVKCPQERELHAHDMALDWLRSVDVTWMAGDAATPISSSSACSRG